MQKVDREATLRRWKKQFRADDMTARRVLNYARRKFRSYTQDCRAAYQRPSVESAKLLRAHVVYLKNNQHRMNYAEALRQGLPVGSGATEGACRSTISVRAKGCGQRWKPTGVDAALTLRAYHISERLPQVWNGLANQYRGEILRAA